MWRQYRIVYGDRTRTPVHDHLAAHYAANTIYCGVEPRCNYDEETRHCRVSYYVELASVPLRQNGDFPTYEAALSAARELIRDALGMVQMYERQQQKQEA